MPDGMTTNWVVWLLWLGLLSGAVLVLCVWLVARCYKQVQSMRLTAAMRQDLFKDMLARGMSPEEIERVLQGSAVAPQPKDTAKDHEAAVAVHLAQLKVSGPGLEQALASVRGADPATKKAVRDALEHMIGLSASEEQVLAAVRGLCPSAGPPPAPKLRGEAALAETLVLLKVSGNVMAQIMEALQGADAATRQAVCQAVEALCEHEPDEGQVLATVRGLCQLQAAPAPAAAPPQPHVGIMSL